jgi:hypothetical protein
LFSSGAARTDLLVPVEQLHALAVDRDLELLPLDLSQQVVEIAGDALHLDHVFAVGRELMLDDHAAACSERVTLDMSVLGGVGGAVVHDLRRRRHIADRRPADLAGRRQIRLDERGRHCKRPRHVVEPVGRVVRREELARVDLHVQQIANGVRVLDAVQSVKAGRREMGNRTAIQLVLHPGDELLARRRIRPRHPRRRHHPGAKLPDDLFADGRVIAEFRQIQLIEQQVRCLQLLVVTGHTILIKERPLGGDVWRGRNGSGRRRTPGRLRRLAGNKRYRRNGQARNYEYSFVHRSLRNCPHSK